MNISYSEVSTALACPARHAFRYTGRLTNGETLHRKDTPSILSDGRAWGAAVAAWHASTDFDSAYAEGRAALHDAYADHAVEQDEKGAPVDSHALDEAKDNLLAIFDDYTSRAEWMRGLHRLEDPLLAPIGNGHGFEGFIDGYLTDDEGRAWLVEFKLRKRLQDAELISRSRQTRWYAWALREQGIPVVGVIVDERLKAAPQPVRRLKSGKPSHDVRQSCEPGAYIAACVQAGVETSPDCLTALRSRVWQRRTPIVYTTAELNAAGEELRGAASLIVLLNAGVLAPLRNVSQMTCSGCDFKAVCEHPDTPVTNLEFTRAAPKHPPTIPV